MKYRRHILQSPLQTTILSQEYPREIQNGSIISFFFYSSRTLFISTNNLIFKIVTMDPIRPMVTRRNTEKVLGPQQQREKLLQQIKNQHQMLRKANEKKFIQQKEMQKILQSNERNKKRILRYRAKMDEMHMYRNKPQYFLHVSGLMNEYVQEFILSHNYHFEHIDMNNPDNMSYQQLLQLGEKMGKVSKGLKKEDMEKLNRVYIGHGMKQHNCSICQTEYQMKQTAIILPCKHTYHQQCISLWFKDQNTCPICKKSAIIEQYNS